MTMDSATQSIENCSVGLSAHFHRHERRSKAAIRLMQLTVKSARVDELARGIELHVCPVLQPTGPGLAEPRPRHSSSKSCRPTKPLAYVRPRKATSITPAIASRPPHTVSMPGRSPVSAIDNAVATAGVR